MPLKFPDPRFRRPAPGVTAILMPAAQVEKWRDQTHECPSGAWHAGTPAHHLGSRLPGSAANRYHPRQVRFIRECRRKADRKDLRGQWLEQTCGAMAFIRSRTIFDDPRSHEPCPRRATCASAKTRTSTLGSGRAGPMRDAEHRSRDYRRLSAERQIRSLPRQRGRARQGAHRDPKSAGTHGGSSLLPKGPLIAL